MKAKRTVATHARLFGIGILMLLGLPHAAQAAALCVFTATHTDGRILGPIGISDTSSDIGVQFFILPGRSYVIEVMAMQGPQTGGFPNFTLNVTTDPVCPVTDSTVGVAIRSIALTAPLGGSGTRSKSVVVGTNSPGLMNARVHSDSGPAFVVFSVTETTLFSPGWSTFGGLQTFWSFLNTTNATINGTITLLDTDGTQVAALGVGILPGRAVFPSTSALGVAANRSGTARFTHDGPPGAVLAEAAITNGSYFQRVRFEPRQR